MTFSNLVLCIALLTLTLIDDTSCIPLRSCPLGLYCPYGYDCKDSGKCVDSCYVINATHQGNDVTGNCEDVSTSNDVWLDSSLYEVFVYRKLDQNEILKNISLIVTYGFWDNASNSGEDISNNITFRLTSSLNYPQFTLNSLSSTFEGFQNENIPEIFSRSLIISSSLQDLTLGDYNMKIQAIFQNRKLAESDVIIHIVDPLPTPLPVPVACIEFDSENYSISSLNLSLTVTLTLSGQAQTEPFDVFVIAKDTLSADSNDFTPGWYRATFEPGSTNAAANGIPILNIELDESVEQFSLELYIPGASYKIGIQSGSLHKAIVNIKDVSEISIAVGEDVIVPESVDVTINCGHLINSIPMPFNITWNVGNNSLPNVAVSQDKHRLIIAPTQLNVGGELGNDGTYTCTVCFGNGTCLERHSHCQICKSPKLNKATIPITTHSTNSFLFVNCGEDLCIGSVLPTYFGYTCGLSSISDDYEVNIYKDNTFYTNKKMIELTDHEIMFPNSLGTYKTVLNDSCGMDVATSVLSLCDMMIVHFDSMIFTGSESSGNITVSMELIRHPIVNGEISVTIIPSDQSPASAQGNGVDYTSTPINATFPAGINSTTVNVPVTSDNIVEITETFQLEIYLPVPAKYAVELGNPSKALVAITDSSNCSISFHQSFYNASENTGSVQVELVLSNPVSFDFTVIIHHHDRSAIGGSDYDAGPYNITIPAGKIHVLFNVTIMNDNMHEEIEWFELYIPTTQELPEGIYFGENLTTNISIEDNDAIAVSFHQDIYEFNDEDEVIQIVLELSNPSSTDITVQIISNDYTAISNVDYIPGPYTVTFPAGVTTVHLNISLLDNDRKTAAEFMLLISYSNETVIGEYNYTIVSIAGRNVLYCNQISDVYFGLSITWDRTPAGITPYVNCSGKELTGKISRKCDVDGKWLPAIVACVRQSFENINDKLDTIKNASLSKEEKLAKTDTIAMVLANITTPLNESYFPQELKIAVDALLDVNAITEKVIESRHPNDTFFKDTAKVLNNLLSSSNEAGWNELQETAPGVNQMLIQSSENFGKILAQTLNNETTKLLETQENIVIKTELTTEESIDEGSSVSFPDDSDDLTMFAGQTTRIELPNKLLKLALSNLSSNATAIPVVNMVFRNLSLILPNTSNASDPVTSVISTQLPIAVNTLDGDPIVLTFNVINKDGNNDTTQVKRQCVFYDYDLKINNGSAVGGWSTQGVTIDDELSNDTIITCYSTHLTSFAVLVSPQDERPPSKEDKALSIISYIGCSVSLLFLTISIIILIFIMRGKPPKKRNPILIHLNLCIALALGLIVFISGIETAVNNEGACKFVAALLQYLFTSAFCWMLCEGVMLYMMLITVFGNKLNNTLFFLALGWGPAIPIVAISLGIAYEHYGTEYYCWIKSDDGAIAAFIAPIGTIILINCVFFVMTLKVIHKNRSGTAKDSFDPTTAKELLKAAMFLLPLLGMTWIIGILAVNNETQVFAWIFAILNSLQGFFLFVFHIARNKEVIAKFHGVKDRYVFGRESSIYNRIYGSKRSTANTTFSKSRESRSSMSEMLPSQSNRKESSCSVDDDVFGGSNTMKKSENTPDISVIHEEPTKQVDPDVSDTTKGQDVAVTYNKEQEVKIVDNSNDTSNKCEAHNEKDEKVETTDNTNKN